VDLNVRRSPVAKILVHVNKAEIRKGVEGSPYTIHTSKGCQPAKSVEFLTRCKTEFKPHLPSNPKVFISCDGVVVPGGEGHFAIMDK